MKQIVRKKEKLSINTGTGIPQKKQILSDEAFLGVWNPEQKVWKMEPKINYFLNADLEKIETCVKQGKMDLAKQKLLDYYIGKAKKYEGVGKGRKTDIRIAGLFMDNIYAVIPPIGNGQVPMEWGECPICLTEAVTDMLKKGSTVFPVMLMGRKKGEEAILHGRLAEHPPVLCLETGEHKTYRLKAVSDTYIRGGSYSETNFGEERNLLIQESGDPVDEGMKRTYIEFYINEEVRLETIEKAELILYGKTSAGHPMDVIAFISEDAIVDEEKKVLANSNMRVLSFEEKEDAFTAFDYKTPKRKGVDGQYYNIITRFWMMTSLLDEYDRTGNEDYADRYIRELLNYYVSLGGGELLLEPEIRSTGGDTLNSGFRLQQTIEGYYRVVKSESMTPERNLQCLKMFYEEREFLQDERTFWPRFVKDCNWGMTQTISQFFVCVYFPELVDQRKHLDEIGKRMEYLTQSLILPDGAYVEATNGYPVHVLHDFQLYKTWMERIQEKVPAAMDAGLRRFARYFMNCTEPGFHITEYGDMKYKKEEAVLWQCLNSLAETYGDEELMYVAQKGRAGKKPKHTSSVYPDGKLAVFRNGWETDALFLFVNWRPFAVHAHNDALNVTLTAYGNRVLADNSDRSYNNDPVAVWQRKSRFSHNVCSIDDRTGFCGWQEGADRVDGDAETVISEGMDVMDGWFREQVDETEQMHRRKLMFLKPLGIFVLLDHLMAGERDFHVYRQNWQFEPLAQVCVKGNMLKTNFAEGGNVAVVTASSLGDPHLCLKISYYDSETSHYGEYTLSTSDRQVEFYTVIVPFREKTHLSVTIKPWKTEETEKNICAAEIGMVSNGKIQKGRWFVSLEEETSITRVGEYVTDAHMAYVHGEEEITYVALYQGSQLMRGKDILIKLEKKEETVSVVYDRDKGQADIFMRETTPVKLLYIYRPSWLAVVRVNHKMVYFTQENQMCRVCLE